MEVDGEEECPGGNARVRWRSADAEAGAGRRGGAGGHREIHAGSISAENGQGGGSGRGRGAAVGTPGGGALRTTRPAPGATAGEQAVTGAAADKRTLGTTQPGPAAAADAWRGTAAEGAYTDGTFDEPQDLTQVTRPPADAPARRTVPKQKPDATSKHPIKPTMAYYAPRQMREKLDQIPVADQTARSPEYKKRPRPS